MYDYFFAGNQYIRVTRGDTGPGVVDAGIRERFRPTGAGVRSAPMVSMPHCTAARSAISSQAANIFG